MLTDEAGIIKYSQTAVLSAHSSEVDEEASHEALDELKTELEFALASQGTRGTDTGLYTFMLQAVPRLILIAFAIAAALMAVVESFPG